MKKGKFGIVLSFYAVLAFILVILKQPLLCALVTGFAIFAEKDEWAGRQTLQALLLSLLVTFVSDVLVWVADIISIPFLSGLFSTVFSVLSVLVYLAAIVFSILAVIKVLRGEDAGIPGISELAYKAYGVARPKPPKYTYAPPPQNSVPQNNIPQNNQAPQYTYQPPVQQNPAQQGNVPQTPPPYAPGNNGAPGNPGGGQNS